MSENGRTPHRRLVECGELRSGGTPNRASAHFWGGTIPWISAKSLKQFDVNSSEERLTDAGAAVAAIVPRGSVLFVVRGMSLANEFRIGVTGREVAFNQDVRALIPANDVDARYLARLLQAASEQILSFVDHASHGTARLTSDRFENVEVPIPSLVEQRRIAEILDKADALRAKRRAALALLDTLTQSIFLDMFGDPRGNPKRWQMRRVADYVAEFRGGKSLEAESEGVKTRNRVLKVSAVTGMQFLAAESKPIPDSYSPSAEHFVRVGDLLFSRANTTELVGAVAYVRETPSNLLLPDKLWRFVWADPSSIEPLFIWALFQTRGVREEIGRRATGTSGSMKNISQEKLLAMSTILPPADLQREFAHRVSSVESLKTSQRAAITELEALFASLQHRAFRGEL